MNKIELIISPKAKDLGGFEVKRALPHRKKRSVGPFIFWDEMGPAQFPKGESINVRSHPHIGLSTLSYLFDGAMLHRDSLGTEQEIHPGDVNLMTAGEGIVHSERGVDRFIKKGHHFHGIQTWLALPLKEEKRKPSFDHIKKENLPFVKEEGVTFRLIMGKYQDYSSPVPALIEAFYAEVKLDKNKGFSFNEDIEEIGIYIVQGKAELSDKNFNTGDMIILEKESAFKIKALSNLHIMIFGGKALKEKRHIYWNFVSSSRDSIEEAKIEWQKAYTNHFKNTFFKQPPNENEYIALPEEVDGPPKSTKDCPTT